MEPLTEEQISHYFREGYVLVPGLAPASIIQSVRKAGEKHKRDNAEWGAICFDHDNPLKDSDVHQLLYEPIIYDAAAQLLGSPARILYGMLAVVAPGGGHGLPWHQDNMYSHFLGGALNLFIAVADITQDMANLWVAPRSHLNGVRPSGKNTTTAPGHLELQGGDPPGGICLPNIKAGDVCIFDRYCLHRSLQNTTNRPRYAYAAQYHSDHARLADTGARDPRNLRAMDLRTMILRPDAT